MTLLNLCGKVAILVSVAIVLIFLILFVLAAFCTGIGAYESVTGHANRYSDPAGLPEPFRADQRGGRADTAHSTGLVESMSDPITEQLKELQETAPRQHPNLTGHTPTWRLKPLIDYHKSEKEQS